jgi:hypothetical protein
MPAEVKTHPATTRPTSLEGAVFTFHSEADRHEGIDKAFDYRGDVTIHLANETIEGYIFNRDPKAVPPALPSPAKTLPMVSRGTPGSAKKNPSAKLKPSASRPRPKPKAISRSFRASS